MIKTITDKFRIKTEPLNWNVQRLKNNTWKDDAFFDRMDQAKTYIMHQEANDLLKPTIFQKFREIVIELGITETSELSAWHLTKVTRHPEFKKKRSLKSTANLKPRTHRSIEAKQPQNEPSVALKA